MLVCKIELWPGGNEKRAIDLGCVKISRAGGDLAHRNYNVELRKTKYFTTNVGMWRFGQILAFDFRRRGPYDLLFRALAETIGKRNIKAERIFEQTMEQLEIENPEPVEEQIA